MLPAQLADSNQIGEKLPADPLRMAQEGPDERVDLQDLEQEGAEAAAELPEEGSYTPHFTHSSACRRVELTNGFLA